MQNRTPAHNLLNQESQYKQTWKTPFLPLVRFLCSSRMLLYHPGTPKTVLVLRGNSADTL